MKPASKVPFYAKVALTSNGTFPLLYTLLASQSIVNPIVLATILAVALDPVVNFLFARRSNRIVAPFSALHLLRRNDLTVR